ncbi:hypothetical protein [Streptomyces sp. NPDC004100]
MRQIPVDTSGAVVMVAKPPQVKVRDRRTGEIATDTETGAKLMTVDVMFAANAARHRVPRGRGHVPRGRCRRCRGGLIMTVYAVSLVLIAAAVGLLRWGRPAWYWLTLGVTLAVLRSWSGIGRSWTPAG